MAKKKKGKRPSLASDLLSSTSSADKKLEVKISLLSFIIEGYTGQLRIQLRKEGKFKIQSKKYEISAGTQNFDSDDNFTRTMLFEKKSGGEFEQKTVLIEI